MLFPNTGIQFNQYQYTKSSGESRDHHEKRDLLDSSENRDHLEEGDYRVALNIHLPGYTAFSLVCIRVAIFSGVLRERRPGGRGGGGGREHCKAILSCFNRDL